MNRKTRHCILYLEGETWTKRERAAVMKLIQTNGWDSRKDKGICWLVRKGETCYHVNTITFGRDSDEFTAIPPMLEYIRAKTEAT